MMSYNYADNQNPSLIREELEGQIVSLGPIYLPINVHNTQYRSFRHLLQTSSFIFDFMYVESSLLLIVIYEFINFVNHFLKNQRF